MRHGGRRYRKVYETTNTEAAHRRAVREKESGRPAVWTGQRIKGGRLYGVYVLEASMKKKGKHNPINYHSNKDLVYGHSLTHSKGYQKGVGVETARREHAKAVRIMKRRGFKHETPFSDRVR